MDPALQALIDGPDDDVLEVITKLADPARAPQGLRIVTRFGSIATGRLRRGDIRRIWAAPEVISLKAPRLLEFADSPPVMTPFSAMPLRRPSVPEQGRNVVFGCIDFGLDFACAAFRRDDGGTRFLGLWDQRDLPGVAGASAYGYGRELDRACIEAALSAPDPYSALRYHPADADTGEGTHGTHVMDIAAGSGRNGGSPGLAPAVQIVGVHLAAGTLGGLANLGDSVRILEALDYVRRVAGEHPCVINFSVGRHAGPHTGGTLVEQAIDAFVSETPGRAVVMSTGNYYRADAHAGGRLTPGRPETVVWLVRSEDPTTNELEIWYRDIDRFHVLLEAPGGNSKIEAGLGNNRAIVIDGREVGRIYHRAFDPNTPDHHIDLLLYPGAPAGDWRLTLLPIEVRDGRWHAWVERDAVCASCQSRLAQENVSPTHTVGSICNGYLSIAVGAVDNRTTPLHMASFSSSGPTRDGRQKPDVVAPGVAILAARSTPFAGAAPALTRKSGASQAAPYVAGTVALIFEAAGRALSIHETRALLLGTARPLSDEDPLRFGAGVVDVEAALVAARGLRSTRVPDTPDAQEREIAMSSSRANSRRSARTIAESCCDRTPSLSFPALEAMRLFEQVERGGALDPGYAESFEVAARPRELIEEIRAGDVVVGRPMSRGRGEIEIDVAAETVPASQLGLPSPDRIVLRLREELRPFPTEQASALAALGAGAAAASNIVGTIDKTVELLEKRVFNGAYRLDTRGARATPFSRGISAVAQRHSATQFMLLAYHPRIGFSDQKFVFRVDLDADCLNIYGVEIIPNYGASSFQVSSDFKITFNPYPEQPAGQPFAVIDFGISGNWDPVGLGEEAFSGRLRVRADGVMELRINSPQNWVRVGDQSVVAAAAACPPPGPAPLSTPAAPITPPDGPSSGGRGSTTALINRLPAGPNVVHVFFTTSIVRLTVNETNRLASWFNQLPPVVQDQVRQGALPVYVTGHASPVGDAQANMSLSYRRAEAAAGSLRNIVGPTARILFQGVGTQQAVGAPGSNDQADRRATIRVAPAGP